MRKIETTESVTCDCCGNLIEKPVSVSENNPRLITEIKFDIWYGGEYQISDVCESCNEKIVELLIDSKLLNFAVRQ